MFNKSDIKYAEVCMKLSIPLHPKQDVDGNTHQL
jgi:hypothetical protein